MTLTTGVSASFGSCSSCSVSAAGGKVGGSTHAAGDARYLETRPHKLLGTGSRIEVRLWGPACRAALWGEHEICVTAAVSVVAL